MDKELSYYREINSALYELNNIKIVRQALNNLASKMKYKEDINAIADVLEQAEFVLENSLENLNNHQLAKDVKFWKDCYQHSLNETIFLTDLLHKKIHQERIAA